MWYDAGKTHCHCQTDDAPEDMNLFKMARDNPGECDHSCQGQKCGANGAGLAIYKTDKYPAIASSCEKIFLEGTWAQGTTIQNLMLDGNEESIECRYGLFVYQTHKFPLSIILVFLPDMKTETYVNLASCQAQWMQLSLLTGTLLIIK